LLKLKRIKHILYGKYKRGNNIEKDVGFIRLVVSYGALHEIKRERSF